LSPSLSAPDFSEVGSAASQAEHTLNFTDIAFANELFGPHNAGLNLLAECAGLHIASRGGTVTIRGDQERVGAAQNLLTQFYALIKSGTRLQPRDIAYAWTVLEQRPDADLRHMFKDVVFSSPLRKTVVAKSLNQRAYVDLLREKDMVFAVGPAGSGKTYLAVAVALSMFLAKRVKRIILTRPAVEAGERLGFLPGDMAEKVNPYLRPLYDALHDMLDVEKVAGMLETGIIEIAPLAFMRGRTLNDAFIILDEAQNTTPEQMKMFVTRLGFGSHMAVTGDITQIDLPFLPDGTKRSGLTEALDVLKAIEGVGIIRFEKVDVIRHPLVGRIVQAYEGNCQKHAR
jgi:phosphate starvation-inducible PhoH-like protein